jgi:hypothetical protein
MATRRNKADTRKVRQDEDRLLAEARHTIARLLAVAYRRFATIPSVAERSKTSSNPGLANTPRSSVHGVVP